MKSHAVVVPFAAALLCTLLVSCARHHNQLEGRWKLIPEKSASIDPWVSLVLDIHIDGNRVAIVKRYDGGNAHDRRVDSMTIDTDGREETVNVPPGRWLGEVSMDVYYGPATQRRVTAQMSGSRNELNVDTRETLQTAQGATDVDEKQTYALTEDESTLRWSVSRSTRRSGPPLTYAFTRVTP